MRVVTFSLYGSNPLYLTGAVRNVEVGRQFYPGWVYRFYVGASVPSDIVQTLSALGAQIVPMSGPEDSSAMFWRFSVFDDPAVDVAVIRDSDSRPTERERAAVEQWLTSDKGFHIMRDHPSHNTEIPGGMWGARSSGARPLLESVAKGTWPGQKGEDQHFLARQVYPHAKRDAMIHDSFFLREFTRKHFPTPRQGLEFVGEIIDENENPRSADREALARAESSPVYRRRLQVVSLARALLVR
jgi:hypothetical protein